MMTSAWSPAPKSFWATIALGFVAFAAQVMRFRYDLIGSETIHGALIVAVVAVWLAAVVWTFRDSPRWGAVALLTAPFALLFLAYIGLIYFACVFAGACI
jgi:hypothetical protein